MYMYKAHLIVRFTRANHVLLTHVSTIRVQNILLRCCALYSVGEQFLHVWMYACHTGGGGGGHTSAPHNYSTRKADRHYNVEHMFATNHCTKFMTPTAAEVSCPTFYSGCKTITTHFSIQEHPEGQVYFRMLLSL